MRPDIGVEQYIVGLLFYFILLLEIYGATIIIYSSSAAFYYFMKTTKDGQNVRLTLASYLAFGLELFLGAEILRTVISRDLEEIKVLAAVIVLRSIFTLLIRWEISREDPVRDLSQEKLPSQLKPDP